MKGYLVISKSAALLPDHVNRGMTKVMTSPFPFYSFNISYRDKRYLSEFCSVKESADTSAEQEQYS